MAVELAVSNGLIDAIGTERFAQQLLRLLGATVISTRPGDDLGIGTIYTLDIPDTPEGAVRVEPSYGTRYDGEEATPYLTRLDWYDAAGRFIRTGRPGG